LWLLESTALEEKYDVLVKEAIQNANINGIGRTSSATLLEKGRSASALIGEDLIPIADEEARKMWFDLIGAQVTLAAVSRVVHWTTILTLF
jgi:hypothetical protein